MYLFYAFIIEYVAFFLFAVVFGIVFIRNPNLESTGVFSLLTGSAGLLVLGTAYLLIVNVDAQITLFAYMRYIGVIVMTPAYVHLIETMLVKTDPIKKAAQLVVVIGYGLAAVLLIFLIFTDGFIYLAPIGEGLVVVPGVFYTYYIGFSGTAVVLGSVLLIVNLLRNWHSTELQYGIGFVVANLILLAGYLLPIAVPALRLSADGWFAQSRVTLDRPNHLGTLSLLIPSFAFVAVYLQRLTGRLVELRESREILQALLHKTKKSTKQMTKTLMNALRGRMPETAEHSARVAELAVAFARTLSYPEKAIELVRTGALMHDIGKIGITETESAAIVYSTPNEYERYRTHPSLGTTILSHIEDLLPAVDIVRHHHERYDGQGYPDGLAGEAIPEMVRIITLCDVYDGLTQHRAYGIELTAEEAVRVIAARKGDRFDPIITDAFISFITTTNTTPEETDELGSTAIEFA